MFTIKSAGHRFAFALLFVLVGPGVVCGQSLTIPPHPAVRIALLGGDETSSSATTSVTDSIHVAQPSVRKRRNPGPGMMVFGAACAAFGAAKKMGVTQHTHDHGESPSYNGANIALMLVGGILCAAGLGLTIAGRQLAPVTLRVTPDDLRVAAGVNF